MKKDQALYFVEMTDTYGGEANYSWVNRFLVKASSELGAIRKVTRKTGYPARKQYEGRYRVPNACITYFIQWSEHGDEANHYSRIETL